MSAATRERETIDADMFKVVGNGDRSVHSQARTRGATFLIRCIHISTFPQEQAARNHVAGRNCERERSVSFGRALVHAARQVWSQRRHVAFERRDEDRHHPRNAE